MPILSAIAPNPDGTMPDSLGTLLVTDMDALVVPGSSAYYKRATHDVGHFASVMDMGDWDGNGSPVWHIATSLSAAQAKSLLAEPLHCYFDCYGQAKVWMDVDVHYLGAQDTLLTDSFGFSDAEARGTVMVYPREFWLGQHASGNPTQGDWNAVFRHMFGEEAPLKTSYRMIENYLDGFENFTSPAVVVRPLVDEPFFTATGINTRLP